MTAVTREERSLGAAAHAAVRLFATDVLTGFRQVSHNALALLGLAAVALVVFLAGRDDVRAGLEGQVLTWLTERANARTELVASAKEQIDGVLLAMAEPEAIQRATAADPAELSRQQSAVVYWLSRRYSVAPEPVSRLVQEAWNVGRQVGLDPSLILAVMAVESGFNPRAVSPKGALGLMQLMPATARLLRVRNAFDPEENIRGGVQYLRQLLDRYEGDEQLALAAYNAGPLAVDRHGQAVPPYRETQQYVSKISGIAGKSSRRAKAPGTQIYRVVEVVDGREVVRYTDKKPE
mgnify:CR=1 FL=1